MLAAAFALCEASVLHARASAGGDNSSNSGRRSSFGSITGSVRDRRGNPLAGALIVLLRDGADEVVKQTRSAADGSFAARVAPGRYLLRAIAEGFTTATFSAVQISASDELVYRFNLEPAGVGRTAPERRSDRNDPKYRIRAAQSRRSVFQIEESEDAVVNAVLEAAAEAEQNGSDFARAQTARTLRAQGVIETYTSASSSALAPGGAGVNFAITSPVSDEVDVVFAGQLGSLERLETIARFRAGANHRLNFSLSGARMPVGTKAAETLGDASLEQLSFGAIDEWVMRDGVVVVLGFDYSRFIGAGGADSLSPRIGFQFDANARTRLRAAYTPGGELQGSAPRLSVASFEDGPVVFRELTGQPIALVDGRAVMERSRRLEFGVERVLDDNSSVEVTVFMDTTDGRGVGLMSLPLAAFATEGGAALLNVVNQRGAARGLRVVYTRRIGGFMKASAGYSFGRGQQLSPEGFDVSAGPDQIFRDGFFQNAAAQVDADVWDGTRVRTVLRFSPRAAVFAIDPFAGRLAVYDPSLSIMVTQELPTFGLPVRAEAVFDARNLLDALTSVEDGDSVVVAPGMTRRTVRGGISVRF